MKKPRHPKLPRLSRSFGRAGITALALAGMMEAASAQNAAYYSFTAGTAALYDTTGASILVPKNDYRSSVTNIGFDFEYEGVVYTQFSVNNYACMKLGPDQIQMYQVQNLFQYSKPLSILPFSADGDETQSYVKYLVDGTAPNRVLVVEWVHQNYSWDGGQLCTSQALLYEGSNVIEFRYGAGGISSPYSNNVAIVGADAHNYLNIRPGPVASNTDTNPLNVWPGAGVSFTFTPPAPCTTPNPGNTLADIAAMCPGLSANLSLQNSTPGSGVSYQWQSGPTSSGPWTNFGAGLAMQATGPMVTTTWYRCEVTCSTGPSTAISNPVEVVVSAPAVTYATFTGTQITEDFASWGNRCDTVDVPSLSLNHWSNTPPRGAGSWRQNNTSTLASGWDNVAGGFFSFGAGAVQPTARFHSRQGNATGSLDFHIDMSAGTGGELLRFEYINSAGNGTLDVMVSQDGGSNFTSLGVLGATNGPPINAPFNTWVTREFIIGSTSAQTVIRLKGSVGNVANGNDIGVDNFRILPEPTCKRLTALAANVTGPGVADFSWTCTTCSGNYIIEYGPTGFTPGTGATAGVNGTVVTATGSPITVTGIPAGNYDLYARENCGGGDFSENSVPKATFSIIGGDFCENAINMATLPMIDWDIVANSTGAHNDYTNSACAAAPGPDVVLYRDVEVGATLSLGAWSSANRLTIAYGGSCPGNTSLACANSGYYFALGDHVQEVNGYETMIWTNTGCQTERVYLLADGLTTGGPVYVFNYAYTPPAGPYCSAVTGVSVSTVNTGNGADVSWNASCSGNVVVEYGLSGFTPGTDGTAGTGGTAVAVSGTTTALSGLTLDAAYDVYVRQDCGGGLYSANSAASTFTVHNGDDCSRVISLGGTSGSITVNTTGANNDAAFCDAGDTGGDLMFTTTVQPWDAIYIQSAPVAPYVGRVVFGAGTACPGQVLLDCQSGAADFYWQNTTGAAVNFYMMQDGADEGETTITWEQYTFEKVVVSITTDNNPGDLSWEIVDDGNQVVASGSPTQANTTENTTVALSSIQGDPAWYGFKLMDGNGDGITGGGWELRTTDGKVILRDEFSTGSSSPANPPLSGSYGSYHSFALPLAAPDVHPAECGVFNNRSDNKVFANKVAGTNYLGGTLNYQFEFSDPDSGYVRRIKKPRNYIVFSELNPSPLKGGKHYFTRVRTDKAGPVADA
ncbi:MAG: hypothetical protein J5I62_09970, partial [Flavobacteriales bacterium]|nr:hypothetical protein [Flavobacteriales bacterium]